MKKSAMSDSSRITIAGEKRFIAFPKRDVSMHAAAVIGEEWLGHKSDRFVVPLGHVAHDVFVILHVVGHLFHRREPNVDFGLTRGRDFVMLALDRNASLLQFETHFIANVLQGVGWRHRKITLLCADLVTEIGKFFARAVPMRFGAFDLIKGGIRG
jgi:hypothetical protein